MVDATLISAPSSTKSASGERDPEIHQSKRGNNWYFGMKAHVGLEVHSGLGHTVEGAAANVNDVTQVEALPHGEETIAFGDAWNQGVDKRPEASAGVTWHVAMKHGLRRALKPFGRIDRIRERMERVKASIRARVEHPFRVLKRQFGYGKVRFAKNTAQIRTLFALSNLWMARRHLLCMA
jgi:IS5 family transposase